MKQLTKEMFKRLDDNELVADTQSAINRSYWQDAWRRFRSNRGAMIALVFILLVSLSAIILPFISNYDTKSMDTEIINRGPFADHYFGIDTMGRDLWVRVWSGTRISIIIGLLAAILDLIIGVIYGSVSGYFGGRVDAIMQRILEVLQGIPALVVLILLIIVMGTGLLPITIAIAMTGWYNMSLVVRAQILQLKSQEFVLAARTLGASHKRIIFKHLIPNTMGAIIVTITLAIPSAIFFEIFLSFIGLGMPVDNPSLGTLVSEGVKVMQSHSYQLWYPIAVIIPIMLSFNLLGDGLRDALDPKSKR